MASGSEEQGGGGSGGSWRVLYLCVTAVTAFAVSGFWYCGHRPPSEPTPASGRSRPVDAQLVSVVGSVLVKSVGALEWQPAQKGMALHHGDQVWTKGSGSMAEIRLLDGTTMQVRPGSLLTLEARREDARSKGRHRTLEITTGRVDFHGVLGQSFQTPTAAAQIGDDTTGAVTVGPGGETGFDIFRGSGGIRPRKGPEIALGEKEGARIDSSGKAGTLVKLPPPPDLVSPSHLAEIAYLDPAQAVTLLSWKRVPAVSYHVMVDARGHFAEPILDRTIQDTTLTLPGLRPGWYYWRVAALSETGVEGEFSQVHLFRLKALNEGTPSPPPLFVEPLDVQGPIVHVRGRTDPTAMVAINSVPVQVRDDGSFDEHITLRSTGEQAIVIRAMARSGGVAEEKRLVNVAR